MAESPLIERKSRKESLYFESSLFSKYSGSASDNPTTKFESNTIHHPPILRSLESRNDQTRKITEATIKSAAKKLEILFAKSSSTKSLKFGP